MVRKESLSGHLPLHSVLIDFVGELKFLGVIFNESLNWDCHTTFIYKSAIRRIYVLRRLKEAGISKSELIVIYNGYIRYMLEYNSPVFIGLNTKNSDRLLKLKRQCHRIICGSECQRECIDAGFEGVLGERTPSQQSASSHA